MKRILVLLLALFLLSTFAYSYVMSPNAKSYGVDEIIIDDFYMLMLNEINASAYTVLEMYDIEEFQSRVLIDGLTEKILYDSGTGKILYVPIT